MNIRCSNRCAKPVRPGDSSFDPTWYHTSTATRGLERSTWRITGSPFSSTNVSNGIVSIGGAKEPASWHESAPARRCKGRDPSILQLRCGRMLALLVALRRARADAGAGERRAAALVTASCCPPDKPQEVVLATNFGMIISEDAGASWLWTCEQPETSFGYLYGVGTAAARSLLCAVPGCRGWRSRTTGRARGSARAARSSSLVASDFFVDRDQRGPRRRHRGDRSIP